MYIDKPVIFSLIIFMFISYTYNVHTIFKSDRYADFNPFHILLSIIFLGISILISLVISEFMFWLTK